MRKLDRFSDMLTSPRYLAPGIALACAAATLASPYLSFVSLPAGLRWPPAGVALVALMISGYAMWPAVLAGILVALLATGAGAGTGTALATVATAQGLAGAWLANRWACGSRSMERTRRFVRFAFVAGVLAAAVGPILGIPALALTGRASTSSVAAAAFSWWLGDGVNTLVIAPALVVWFAESRATGRERVVPEAVGLAAALGLTWLLLFSGWLPMGAAHDPLEVLCVPALLWAAYRFGPRVASLSVVGLAAVALGGTRAGTGPFAIASPVAAQFALQAFVAITTVTTLALATVTRERRAAERRLSDLARTDGLTGLANFRALEGALADEIGRAMRRGRPFALIVFDLDRLKEINDTLGHLMGNVALRRMAAALQVNCRAVDTAARIGGDEFCVLMPDADESAARLVIDRVQGALAAHLDGPRISTSSGLATYPRDGATGESLLAAADLALYRAKSGRAPAARPRTGHKVLTT